MNMRVSLRTEGQLNLAMEMIKALTARVDGLAAEVAELRRMAFPEHGYVRITPDDKSGSEIISGLLVEASIAYGIPCGIIAGNTRGRAVSRARQWVMFEACARGLTTPQVGRLLRRDPSTVMHGVRTEAERRREEARRGEA